MSQPNNIDPDMKRLISRVREIITPLGPCELQGLAADELTDLRERIGKGSPAGRMMVLAEDTAVELGSPRRASLNTVLWTREPSQVEDGRVTLIGPDLPDLAGGEGDYAQLMLLELAPEGEVDLFKLDSIQYLSRRLPGVMARMMPGRLWLRVSKRAMQEGLTFSALGAALRRSGYPHRQESDDEHHHL